MTNPPATDSATATAEPEPHAAPDATRDASPVLSVVIPLYNEAKRLPKSAPTIKEFLARQHYVYELVLVDDGSSDGTASLARSLFSSVPGAKVIESRPNRGKGHAVKLGMLEAAGKFRLFCDADLSTPLDELQKFWPFLETGYEVVIGSRKMKGAHIERHQPWWRENLGKVFTWLTNHIATKGISDITCGFKVFSAEASKRLFSRSVVDDWSFDAEVLFIAQQMGYKLKEVPVSWHDTPGTKVRLLKDASRSIAGLLRVRLNGLRGKYR